jgi:hypothetical protein
VSNPDIPLTRIRGCQGQVRDVPDSVMGRLGP